jgi:hypothetical protein
MAIYFHLFPAGLSWQFFGKHICRDTSEDLSVVGLRVESEMEPLIDPFVHVTSKDILHRITICACQAEYLWFRYVCCLSDLMMCMFFYPYPSSVDQTLLPSYKYMVIVQRADQCSPLTPLSPSRHMECTPPLSTDRPASQAHAVA